MLVLPLYRLVAAGWPPAVEEYLLPDGRTLLLDAGTRYRGDGVARSRPANAARVQYGDGRVEFAYVVALTRNGRAQPLPQGVVWSPSGSDCELALKPGSGRRVVWLDCEQVAEIAKPNRMSPSARARLALQPFLPRMSIQP
jgi:hypothetical protein